MNEDDRELLLEYLTKKLSTSKSEFNTNSNCNEFTGMFTGKIPNPNELVDSEILQKKLNEPTTLGVIMNFEQQLNQINCKFPFFHFKSFLEDYYNGVYKSQIIENYQLTSTKDVQEIIKILKLPKRKEKLKINDISNFARLTNMKNFNEIYYEFIENYNLFKNEINNVYFSNLLKSKLILEIINGSNKKEKLNQKMITSFKEFAFLNKFILNTLSTDISELRFNQLEVFITSNLDCVLKKLLDENIIKEENDILIFNNNLIENEINTFVINEISSNQKGCSFKQLMDLLIDKFNYFYYLPCYSILKTILENLESEHKIKSQTESNKKHGLSEKHFFSTIFYEKQIKRSTNEEFERKPFFGRANVSGTEFLYELERLEKGDLDDIDDQITRIAGLILTTNQKIMKSIKSNSLFDLSTDVIQYRATSEEKKLMNDVNFVLKLETQVMHIKIMIHEKVTEAMIKEFSNFSNSSDGINSQIVIISFEDNSRMIDKLPNDYSIQIVNKNELSKWIDLVPTIPCRKGTIVKIMRGEEFRSIGKILRMYYDTGTATLTQIGTSQEITCMIGDLEEINLSDQRGDDYSLIHDNFFNFLNRLIKLFDHNLVVETIFGPIVNYNETKENEYYLDYLTHHEINDLHKPLRANLSTENNNTIINSSIKIEPLNSSKNKIFQCNCNNFINYTNTFENNSKNLKICEHLIIVLMDIGITNNLFSNIWGNDNNLISNMLNRLENNFVL